MHFVGSSIRTFDGDCTLTKLKIKIVKEVQNIINRDIKSLWYGLTGVVIINSMPFDDSDYELHLMTR